LLFECAYAELFFTETLWPDFTEATLDEAIAAYSRRQRRFGRTGDQVRAG
jgi:undecaprenyl diphosphate synthase